MVRENCFEICYDVTEKQSLMTEKLTFFIVTPALGVTNGWSGGTQITSNRHEATPAMMIKNLMDTVGFVNLHIELITDILKKDGLGKYKKLKNQYCDT